jgi:hypothetical protein
MAIWPEVVGVVAPVVEPDVVPEVVPDDDVEVEVDTVEVPAEPQLVAATTHAISALRCNGVMGV